VLPIDSNDCRNNVVRCIEMANEAVDDKTQSMLFELAKNWMRMAKELEANEAFRNAVKDLDVLA
jgi:hypothetical protein